MVLPIWTVIGLLVYFAYGRSRSHLGRGVVEVVDDIGGQEHQFPIDTPESHPDR